MHVQYQFVSNLQAALPLQQRHKYSSIVLFAHLHSHKLLRSFIDSFAMNNVAHLMSDGRIIVSLCWPHISCSAQFTIGRSVISQLHASHCCPVRGWFAEKHALAFHTPTQISADLWLLGCYWSVPIELVCHLPADKLHCWLKGKSLAV